MRTVPKAYSYLRFSTAEQSKGDSFRRQTSMAERYISRHPELQLELDTTLKFEDLGVSAHRGKNAEKGSLRDFLEAVEAGLVPAGSYLLVESLDRISRQTALLAIGTLQAICNHEITVVTLNDEREYSAQSLATDSMSLIGAIFVFIRAHEESATKGRRIKASWEGRRAMASRDNPVTATGPAWLKFDKEKGEFVKIAERVKIVRRIFRETLKGDGKVVIARRLNEEGVPVFGRGKHWHTSYVTKVLLNPAVVGTFVPHTEEYDNARKRIRRPLAPIHGYYPPVIDEETYERVRAMSRDVGNPFRGRHANSSGTRNLFGGVLRCGRCGAAVTRVNKGPGSKGGTYLVCTAAKVGAGCKYEAVRYATVEASFLDDAGWILSDAPAGARGSEIDKELERVETLLLVQSEQLENLSKGLAHRYSAALAARIREAEDERDRLQSQRTELLQQRDELSGPLVARKREELLAVLQSESFDRTEANALLRQVFSTITLDYDDGGYTMGWKHGGTTDAQARWRFPQEVREKLPVRPKVPKPSMKKGRGRAGAARR